jgi:hypothetical protein
MHVFDKMSISSGHIFILGRRRILRHQTCITQSISDKISISNKVKCLLTILDGAADEVKVFLFFEEFDPANKDVHILRGGA